MTAAAEPEVQHGFVFAFLMCGKDRETWGMFIAHRAMRLLTRSHVVHVAVAKARREADGRVCLDKTAFSTSPLQAPFQPVPVEECTSDPGYEYIFAPTPFLDQGLQVLHALVGAPYPRVSSAFSILCQPTKRKPWVAAQSHACVKSIRKHNSTLTCSQAAAIVCLECGILDSCVQPELCAPHELYCLLRGKYGLLPHVFVEPQAG